MSRPHRPVELVTYNMPIVCPRCGRDELLNVHWWGDDDTAAATGISVVHACPVQPHYPEGPLCE